MKLRAPESSVDDELRQSLRLHKTDLLNALDDGRGYRLLCPLSYNQHSLFFLNLLEPASPAYNLALSMRILSPVDPEALGRSVGRLVRRHEQLRTTYGHLELGDEQVPCQFVHEELPPIFEVVDAAGWTDSELSLKAHAFYRAPLDLRKGPVVRTGLFRRGNSDSVLVVVIHHISADGWSMNRILQDLAVAYREETSGEKTVNEPAITPYTDFALEQERLLKESAGEEHLLYWISKLKPQAPDLELVKNQRPTVRRSAGATHYFSLPSEIRENVERRAQELGITSFAMLLSVFQWFLFIRSNERDIVAGIPILGHKGHRFEETVGYFVNPLPIRSRVGRNSRFREHALNTARDLREVLDHRETPFAAIVERLGGTRDASRTPVFQVLFNLLSRKTLGDVVDLLYPFEMPPEVDFAGLKTIAFPLDQQEGQFDLTMELVDRGTDILGILKYCTDLFTPEESATFATDYRSLLDSAVADPDAPLFPDNGETVTDHAETPVLAITATFTAEVFDEFFDFWSLQLCWQIDSRFAPFNQVFQELLDPGSLLRTNRNGWDVAFIRFEDLMHDSSSSIQGILDTLLRAVETAAAALSVPLCIVLCPSSPQVEEAFLSEGKLLDGFLDNLRRIPGVVVITHKEVVRHYPVTDFLEPLGDALGHIPYTRPYLSALATSVVRVITALSRKPVKAIAVDCDGTLWEGVVGEDGPAGVKVASCARRFQEFLLEQYRAGVILCLCSKNREEDVWAVLDLHPDMVLRREHVAFRKINWEPKSANLRALAIEMNISLDAIAFLDDNPLERAEVRSGTPSVYCPELPTKWSERVEWLEHLWAFDHPRVTDEDRKRQEHYRSDRLREDLKQKTSSLREFLDNLGLRIDLRPVTSSDIDRVSQLTVRTNQFNTTGLRLTPQELTAFLTYPGQSAHVAFVSDRFGDYGLVGAMLASTSCGALRADALYLSCRALGRGVEHRMVAYMGALARDSGCDQVRFPVRALERNEPARTFMERVSTLCDGSHSDGFIEFSAERLAEVTYEPAEFLVDSTNSRGASSGETRIADTDRNKIERIAKSFRSVDEILTELDRPTPGVNELPENQKGADTQRSPANETERVIASVWKRALKLDDVSTRANFFELGGTSLLIARIAIELQHNHGLAVSIVDLFQYPTIAELSSHLKMSTPDGDKLEEIAGRGKLQREALRAGRMPAAFKRLKAARGDRR